LIAFRSAAKWGASDRRKRCKHGRGRVSLPPMPYNKRFQSLCTRVLAHLWWCIRPIECIHPYSRPPTRELTFKTLDVTDLVMLARDVRIEAQADTAALRLKE
jgi:hypothetical protein